LQNAPMAIEEKKGRRKRKGKTFKKGEEGKKVSSLLLPTLFEGKRGKRDTKKKKGKRYAIFPRTKRGGRGSKQKILRSGTPQGKGRERRKGGRLSISRKGEREEVNASRRSVARKRKKKLQEGERPSLAHAPNRGKKRIHKRRGVLRSNAFFLLRARRKEERRSQEDRRLKGIVRATFLQEKRERR